MTNIFYQEKKTILILDDTLLFLKKMKSDSIDMIFADPPYFLSNGGFSNSGGKRVSVDKGEWDKIDSLEKKHRFNSEWIKEAKRILKPNGTIWITGTFHNIYSVGMALEEQKFKILNNITWQKTDPAPNLSCRMFTHSAENIIWAKKGKYSQHYFNYNLMKKINHDKQMQDVWLGPKTPRKEKKYGKHPTQKPEYLLERIILASTKDSDYILDPFVGSGTTGVVAKRLNRKFIGVDYEKNYLEIAKNRILSIE
ncbi:DNA-methyltransferase [Enterococcus sp. LJL98]